VIHMNGRIYDPLVGRFMSSDPFIDNASDLQNYNRYAYVRNNPLRLVDPSGYGWLSSTFGGMFKAFTSFSIFTSTRNLFNLVAAQPGQKQVDQYVMNNPVLYAAGQVAATAFTAICGGCGGAIWSSYYAYQSTGSVAAAYRAGATTYATTYAMAQAFNWAGDVGEVYGKYGIEHFGAHAAVGCVSSVASGGSCGSGALSGVSGLAGTAYGLMGSTIAGGVGSMIAGGKFESGAVTAAFGYLFNNCLHNDCWGRPDTLQDHFDRHGRDFGVKSSGDYARLAQDFRTSALSTQGTEFRIDTDGTLRIYDRVTNTFASYNADGSTKTFYKPGAGESYWDASNRATKWGEKIDTSKPENLTRAGKALRITRIIGRNLE
jgi:hypothetical protein